MNSSHSDTTATERSSLLDRRNHNRSKNYNIKGERGLYIPLPSPFREQQEPLAFPTSAAAATSSNHNNHRFKWFNKRTGSYDEDRQGLVKENTGIRVWSESYSSIGKEKNSFQLTLLNLRSHFPLTH